MAELGPMRLAKNQLTCTVTRRTKMRSIFGGAENLKGFRAVRKALFCIELAKARTKTKFSAEPKSEAFCALAENGLPSLRAKSEIISIERKNIFKFLKRKR